MCFARCWMLVWQRGACVLKDRQACWAWHMSVLQVFNKLLIFRPLPPRLYADLVPYYVWHLHLLYHQQQQHSRGWWTNWPVWWTTLEVHFSFTTTGASIFQDNVDDSLVCPVCPYLSPYPLTSHSQNISRVNCFCTKWHRKDCVLTIHAVHLYVDAFCSICVLVVHVNEYMHICLCADVSMIWEVIGQLQQCCLYRIFPTGLLVVTNVFFWHSLWLLACHSDYSV